MVGDPWLRDARIKIYITFRAARRKFDDAVEEARAGREKGGRNRKEEPRPGSVPLGCSGCLLK